MDKTRIIVVEDNIVYCEFVCNLLAREGFRTVQAYHLSTAKKLLQQASDGDIVVSDLRLPDGDGIDLLRWMRKEGMTQPLIIMTNYAEVHTAVRSIFLMIPMEITAAGIDADTVIPTLSPRYAFAPPNRTASTTPSMIEVTVISGSVESTGTNGLKLFVSSLISSSPF